MMKKLLDKASTLKGLLREGVPDDENPEWTATDFKNAKRGLEGLAELIGEEAVAPLRKMGRPKSATPKRNGTLRLAAEIWDALKASGKGYNVRVEAVLREALAQGRI